MSDSRVVIEVGHLEELLRERELQLRDAMAIGVMGYWEWDLRKATITWSRELRQIFGVDEGFKPTLLGFMEFVHPEDRAWAMETTANSQKTGSAHTRPFRIIRPDGAIRILKGTATTSQFEAGRPVRLVGVIQDIGDARLIPEFAKTGAALDRLSQRERQVLMLVVQGGTSKAIAKILAVSPGTIDTYRSRIMRKLGIDDLAGLVRFSINHGLIRA